MKTIKLKIVTPERIVLEENVDSVVIPTIEGEITVLPGHVSLISALRSGDIVAKVGEEIIPMAVAGGFIEIKHPPAGGPGGTEVAILADFAEHVFEISDEVVTKAKDRAEELAKITDSVDFEHFESELERSLTRVRIADKWKGKKYRKL